MRYKLLLLILLPAFSLSVKAQRVKAKGVKPTLVVQKEAAPRYTIEQFDGKWQEITRTPVNSKEPVGFTDTLLMNFNKNKVELKDATSMSMSVKGMAQIEAPNILAVAGDAYSIISLDKNKLVINDGDFIRELKKTDQFYYETVGKIKVDKETFSQPVSIDIQNIKGKWLVYSRQAAPGSVTDQTAIIKTLNITQANNDGTASGEVLYYLKDMTENLPCKLNLKDGNLQIISDKYIWNFYSYKADGNEFVFGETGKLVYYSKH